MKILIVFCALLKVFSVFLSYSADMNTYMRIQYDLKILAEDCAEAGALTIDETAGKIDAKTALTAALEILNSSGSFPAGSVSIESYEVTDEGRGFSLCLLFSCDDIFRLDFISVTSVRRMSGYVWE